MLAEMRAPIAMLGIMVMGASPVMAASPNAWDCALMVVTTLAGGLDLGIAFMGFADQAALSDAPRQPVGAPQSDG